MNERIEFVYLFECDGLYKIGRSLDISQRLDAIQSCNPYEIVPDHEFAAYPASEAERQLHQMCSEWNIGGEWFDLPEYMIDWIRGIGEYRDGKFWREVIMATPIKTGACTIYSGNDFVDAEIKLEPWPPFI